MTKLLDPITPGEILLEEFLKPLGMSQNKLAELINVPSNRINQIVNGKREISADTALRLSKFFGSSAEFWLNLQTRYNLKLAERNWKKVESKVSVLSELDLNI